jgi:hypothetical protein
MARSARHGRHAENAVFGKKFKARRCKGGMRERDEAYCSGRRVRPRQAAAPFGRSALRAREKKLIGVT